MVMGHFNKCSTLSHRLTLNSSFQWLECNLTDLEPLNLEISLWDQSAFTFLVIYIMCLIIISRNIVVMHMLQLNKGNYITDAFMDFILIETNFW